MTHTTTHTESDTPTAWVDPALRAFLDYEDRDGALQDLEDFDARFIGHYDSREAWAMEHMETTGILNELPAAFRAWDGARLYAREAADNGVLFVRADHGGVLVFRSC